MRDRSSISILERYDFAERDVHVNTTAPRIKAGDYTRSNLVHARSSFSVRGRHDRMPIPHLGDNLTDDFCLVNISQFFVPRIVLIRQMIRIYAEQVQYSRVKVSHTHWLVSRMIAEFICGPMGVSAFGAAPASHKLNPNL